jgi:phosphopantetheinyl transferase
MPFLGELNPAEGIRAGIWQISETAAELLSTIHLGASESQYYATFRNDLRKRQWLAYRALLKHLLAPEPPSVSYDCHGKPYLDSASHHISVSHAGEFAAAAISKDFVVGIDIEKMKDRVERVKERFLGKNELESLSNANRLEQLYVYWCGKEALYKLHGNPEVDFRNDIYIHPFDYLCNTNPTCRASLRLNACWVDHTLYFRRIEDYMLVVAY